MVLVKDDWWNKEGPVPLHHDNSEITRNWFPKDFIFGTATSSYQVEGAYAEDGKGISIWDDFTLSTPDKIDNGTNGVVACDMYHRYKEDIRRMKQMGFDSYRFSLSWTRILPGGRAAAGVNRKGIEYYNDVINTVIEHGMVPCVTIFHWDTPDCLEKQYGGFMDERIKDDFREFAEICFYEFGDRVKIWATLNEPLTYSVHGYVKGIFPPGKKLPGIDQNLHKLHSHRKHHVPHDQIIVPHDVADPKDVYTCARNLLLAHGEAAQLYRKKFKEAQQGKIGIVLNTNWCEPMDPNSEADKAAASRAMDFMLGWFLGPALYGHYPHTMIDNVDPKNLSPFTTEESEMLKNSIDFLGLNYYTGQYVADDPHATGEGYIYDQRAKFDIKRERSHKIGKECPGSSWLHMVPWGLYSILKRIKEKYSDLEEIYITENGCSDKYDFKIPARKALDDRFRRKYYQDHLANLVKVMKDTGVNVKGYYAWSWCDNFEWNAGYSARFGLVYVDYLNNQTRYPKDSCAWFAEFFRSKRVPPYPLPWNVVKGKGKRSYEGYVEFVKPKRLYLKNAAIEVAMEESAFLKEKADYDMEQAAHLKEQSALLKEQSELGFL